MPKIVAVAKFVATDWSQLLGTGFANLIGEAFSSFGGGFIERMSSALIEADAFLGSDLHALNNQNYQDQIEAQFLSIDEDNVELIQLNENRITFQSGDMELSISGENFNTNLLDVVSLLNSGASVEQTLIDAIAGQVTSYEIRDLSTGNQTMLHFPFQSIL